MDLDARAALCAEIARKAGELALSYFSDQASLTVDAKGHQDFVSQADREVETMTRHLLSGAFPDDGIVGEEHAPLEGTSGFTWVIDPIDGTANFVNAIPAWTVVIAGVAEGRTQIGVTHDPCHDETFVAIRGKGATLNGAPLRMDNTRALSEGTVGVGYSNRVDAGGILRVVQGLGERGAMFHRNASGALSLVYVAAGRFLGYVEEHMNAWDCLAGQLIVAEAGGRIEAQDADAMIANGGRVVVGTPAVFDDLVTLADETFGRD
jgi:myo-inositol-1(or 4)-monophosphatase